MSFWNNTNTDYAIRDYVCNYERFRRVHEPTLPSAATLLLHPTFRGVKYPTREERSYQVGSALSSQPNDVVQSVLNFFPCEEGRLLAVEDSWYGWQQEVPVLDHELENLIDGRGTGLVQGQSQSQVYTTGGDGTVGSEEHEDYSEEILIP